MLLGDMPPECAVTSDEPVWEDPENEGVEVIVAVSGRRVRTHRRGAGLVRDVVAGPEPEDVAREIARAWRES